MMRWFYKLAPSINKDRKRFFLFREKNMGSYNLVLVWLNISSPSINQDRKIFFPLKKKMSSNMHTRNHV